MRNIFIHPEQETIFRKQGYIVIPELISKQEIYDLENYYYSLPLEKREGFHVSNYGESVQVKKLVSKKIQDIIGKKITPLLENYKPLTAFYYVKERDDPKDFNLHLDWTLVNESIHNSIAAWVPLTDVTEQNGTLIMLEGSQNEAIRFRGNPGFCFPGYDLIHLEQMYKAKKMNLAAGDAVVWTHRMFHGSVRNKSGKIRIAASQVLIPVEAQPILFHLNENKSVSVFYTSEDFFSEFQPGKNPPAAYLHTILPDVNNLFLAD